MPANGNEILNGAELTEDPSFNWKLFLTIGWINRWWIVIYFIIVIVTAYLLGRYTTPIYESRADIQFNDKSKDNAIDLGILVSKPNIDRLNEEMTILNSKGYKVEALRSLPLGISYFIRERVKAGEIYTNSPFVADIGIIDSAIIGTKIEFENINKNSYQIAYDFRGEHFSYVFEYNK
ncbi:MAG: Wzz/FepE/Etk N-terminal domain-containing protein, partial [Chitinophagales bacterium]